MDLGTRRSGASFGPFVPAGRGGSRAGPVDRVLALTRHDAAGFSFLPDSWEQPARFGGSGPAGGAGDRRDSRQPAYAPVSTGEVRGTDRETTLERVARQLRHGLFGVLFTMNKNSGSGPQAGSDRVDLALMMVDFLQVRGACRPRRDATPAQTLCAALTRD